MLHKTPWIHEFQTAFRNSQNLWAFLEWPHSPEHTLVNSTYPLFVPQRLAKRIKVMGPQSVLAREFLPHYQELQGDGLLDPIGDRAYQVAPQLIHRYYNRALFTATSVCPVHCRYCFRKNELDAGNDLFLQQFDETLRYLQEHPEISEIIFTGGDPWTLSNDKLAKYLQAFAELKTIKDVRFHTRFPVILPSRLDSGLLSVLAEACQNFRTVSVAIHANHLDEFDEEANNALQKLHPLSLQLLSQTVLLKDINDSVEALKALMEHFIALKIRPYYLHHPDQVKGGRHFYLSLPEGRAIYSGLRKLLPGWALPHYVIDVPGGHGKVPAFNPETTAFSGQLLTQHLDTVRVDSY